MKAYLIRLSLPFLLTFVLVASVSDFKPVHAGTLPSGMTWIQLGDDPARDEKTVTQGYDDIYNNTEYGGTCSTEIANNQTWLFYKMHIRDLHAVSTRMYFMYIDNRSDNTGDTLKKWNAIYTFEYALSVDYVKATGVWTHRLWKFTSGYWAEQVSAQTDGYYYDAYPTGDDYVWAGVRLSDIGYVFSGIGDFCLVFTTESTQFPNQGDTKDHDPNADAHCVPHSVIPEIPLVVLPPFLALLTIVAYRQYKKKFNRQMT